VIEPKDLPPEVLGASEGGDPTAYVVQDTTAFHAAPSAMSEEPHRVPSSHAPMGAGDSNAASTPVVLNMPGADWEQGLEAEAMSLLVAGRTDVWEVLVNRFEARLIQTALVNTRGRRIEAAQKLGIGRNTITRKIQELGLDD
jgi:two-component system nitrogen regulation response regulator GlnG